MPDPSRSSSASPDHRDFFRIDEEVLFEFKQIGKNVPEDQSPEDVFEDSNGSLELINQIKKLDQSSAQSLKILTDKNRLLGDYLNSITKRIDLIARHVAFANENSMKKHPKTRISLSEDGLGFISDKTLYKGSYIALRLIFLPNYSVVNAYARVVRCIPKDDCHQVAVRFHQLYDKDRQTISKHILKAQVRNRKQGS